MPIKKITAFITVTVVAVVIGLGTASIYTACTAVTAEPGGRCITMEGRTEGCK